ncbi:Hypothetical protein NTJ_07428 [Nesidiocoris tenuis]|uniref:Caspase family p20 domain-containing protein n=2 Tax=Nesidiocoris tenuis TaxID=355587 RepID=A0ABN7ATK7_9HEMI|nr:Hypothetical protein NTJ_07428 [Nesidiocoris tenuis]
MNRKADRFYKRCQASRIFAPKRLSSLVSRGIVDVPDLISIVFLTCDQCQMEEMLDRLVELKNSDLSTFDSCSLFENIKNRERKLFEALVCINNRKALLELKISSATIDCNKKRLLSQPRVILYRIIESLRSYESSIFIEQMNKASSISSISEDEPYLEICLMRWQVEGFIDIESQQGFDRIASALNSIPRPDLAATLAYSSSWTPDVSFNFDYPLDMYNIKDHDHPGLCIIINQINYGNLKTNRGSSVQDVSRLRAVLTKLKFLVVDYEDVSAAEFPDTVNRAIVDNFTEDHSIMLMIVMAHGGDGFVTCPTVRTTSFHSNQVETLDDITGNLRAEETSAPSLPIRSNDISVADIQKCLLQCKSLQAVPKILILNSCRGPEVFRNREYFQNADYVADECYANRIQPHVDLITCYTTLPGYLNFRDIHQGSLFMQVFCDILSIRPDIEVGELFTLINARLMVPTPALSKDFEPSSLTGNRGIANPCDFTSCLTKKLYLSVPQRQIS